MLSTKGRSASLRMTAFGISSAWPLMSPSFRPRRPPRLRTADEGSAPRWRVMITRDVPLLPTRLFRSLSSLLWLPDDPDCASAGPPSPTTKESASTPLVRLRCHRITISVLSLPDTSRVARGSEHGLPYRYLQVHLRQWVSTHNFSFGSSRARAGPQWPGWRFRWLTCS